MIVGAGGLKDERGSIGGDEGIGSGRRCDGNAFFILVSLYMLGQVVAAHEPLGALHAHELLLSWETQEEQQLEKNSITHYKKHLTPVEYGLLHIPRPTTRWRYSHNGIYAYISRFKLVR